MVACLFAGKITDTGPSKKKMIACSLIMVVICESQISFLSYPVSKSMTTESKCVVLLVIPIADSFNFNFLKTIQVYYSSKTK
jgi:hypothetical protein